MSSIIQSFTSVSLSLLDGFKMTVLLFALTLVMALPLGLLVSFGSNSRIKAIRAITMGYVWIMRGTPLMLQIMVVFYGPGIIFGITVGSDYRFTAAVIAFVINYAAYFSEIFRGGINAVSIGQFEAGQVLGMTRSQVFFKVILIQVIKNIVPPISNEIITLVKDTSLVRIISVAELIKSSEYFVHQGIIWPLFYTGVYYLVFCGLLTILFKKIERKLDYFKS